MKGLLKKGLIMSLKYIFDIFTDFIPYYLLQPADFKTVMQQWSNVINAEELDKTYEVVTNFIEIYR